MQVPARTHIKITEIPLIEMNCFDVLIVVLIFNCNYLSIFFGHIVTILYIKILINLSFLQ
jgi:hypothetical protein